MRVRGYCVIVPFMAAISAPAAAELIAADERGFVSHHEAQVAASPSLVWEAMIRPSNWWNGDHTYSGSAENLTLKPVAGGCFCETIPEGRGEIEHMRVVYAAPGSTLRLSGGLGPLQSEAVTGVLTMTIEPAGEGTKIAWDYVVGGYMRTPTTQLAPVVDRVIGEQFSRLTTSVGPS